MPPAASGGIGFLGALTLALIILKITHHIAWSWWWVWAPVWIPAALVFVGFVVTLAIVVATDRGSAVDRGNSAGRHRRQKTQAGR